MTSSMYLSMAEILNDAAQDDGVLCRAVGWRRRLILRRQRFGGFLKHPPGPGESPQAQLANALLNFDKPLIAAVKGVAIGGGTTLLTHCDFVFAGESARFQLPFVNLGLVPEFGSFLVFAARSGYIRAAELICWPAL